MEITVIGYLNLVAGIGIMESNFTNNVLLLETNLCVE